MRFAWEGNTFTCSSLQGDKMKGNVLFSHAIEARELDPADRQSQLTPFYNDISPFYRHGFDIYEALRTVSADWCLSRLLSQQIIVSADC